jgi:hypothetical protein
VAGPRHRLPAADQAERAALTGQLVHDTEGFVTYDELGIQQVRRLAGAVHAQAEPLSRMTAVVVS